MSWNGFGSLDLSDVSVSEGGGFRPLPTGEYLLKALSAEVETNGSNKRLVVQFKDVGGAGEIRSGFWLVHSSAKAQEIGREQLKTFLTAAGHRNPNRPGDVSSILGLQARAYVGPGKPYTNSKGQEVINQEVKRFLVDAKQDMGARSAAIQAPPSRDIDDDIPF